ncbi:LysR family transcriptional regulator [Bradyrhizobium mercantei]|uniref:LysR family transcriptional regulator n=1 Tax=Bradyrhizobium mercantei TaxID=1904807 RepID=UPI0009770438|nr:LysR family transcriptional regulator [Bradyrhizobium mercantei]
MISDGLLNGIRTFVSAAEAGSFAVASERLGLSRSATSKSIARLEERLGVQLFNRTTRSLGLTEQGQAFYEKCARALADLQAAELSLVSGRQVPAGKLRVDLPVVFGRQCVMPALLDVVQRYPEIQLDVTFNNRRVDLIEEGYDLVIRIGHLDDSTSLVARRLGVQTMAICAAPSYARQRGLPRTPDEIESHDCIIYYYGGRNSPWFFPGADGQSQLKHISGRLRLGSGDAIADAALAGRGIAQLPTWLIAPHLKSGSLVVSMPDCVCAGLPIHALWPQGRQLTPKVRVVVDELAARFLPVPPWEVDLPMVES